MSSCNFAPCAFYEAADIKSKRHRPKLRRIPHLNNRHMTRISIATIATVFALTACNGGSKPLPQGNEATQATLPQVTFSADSAYSYVAAQTAFGPRVPNTSAHAKCVDYLTAKMRQFGAEVSIQEATGAAYDGTPSPVRNIIASYRPDRAKRILLCAHYDSRPWADHDNDKTLRDKPISGANDGASGVGVLMEIGRQLQAKAPNVGVDIIFFDAEDAGTPDHKVTAEYREDTWCVGSQIWSKGPGRDAQHLFGILLDMVGDSSAVFPVELFSKAKAADIVDKVWTIAERTGHSDRFVRTEGSYITDDHYYINKLTSIPTIDIIHYNNHNDKGFCDTWHTQDDVIDHISRQTLKDVGEVVLTVVYAEK